MTKAINPLEELRKRGDEEIEKQAADGDLSRLGRQWLEDSARYRYSYHFTWLGMPIIQYPQDIVALQELIWSVKPDLVIETGVAHGGSLVLYASILAMLGGDRRVVGIDIDIREHNRRAIENHPLYERIELIQGSSVDEDVVRKVADIASGYSRPLVVLDSNHTHEHVLSELEMYSPMVKKGSYLVVLDTVVEDMPDDLFENRPWGKGNNPKTAVHAFLAGNNRFEIDHKIDGKLLLTVAPSGYLKCIRD